MEEAVAVVILCLFFFILIVSVLIIELTPSKPRFQEVKEDVKTQYYNMGEKYYKDAIAWYKKSARLGDQKAQEKLKQLGEEW